MTIRFGTDGWRAVIGQDFTPENVAHVIHAFADLYPSLPHSGHGVVVGYDRRDQSPEMARLVADLLTTHGIPTALAATYVPTPFVSWSVVQRHATAGIMITASHNPPRWNGIKFKESYGGAAAAAFTNLIEAQIVRTQREGPPPRPPRAAPLTSLTCDAYLAHLRGLVDLKAIGRAHLRLLFDPLYGAGAGLLQQLVDDVTEIHGNRDVAFGGLHPEPIVPYVNEAMETMRTGDFDLCVITDGDADRIGAIDERGRYITTHEIYGLLLQHVLTHKQWTGNVVKSITTTQMIDRICRTFQLALQVTPVGFKHISPALNAPHMLVGGEESGGFGFPRHVCERDGLFCALLLLELCAVRGKKIGALVAELQQTYGPTHYRRIDLKLTPAQMHTAQERLEKPLPTTLCGKRVTRVNRIDGYHFLREDDSWLLVRASGTEPLFRTYAEAASPDEVEALLGEAQRLIGIA
ncbi:MAG: phosphoglucomutase/phosphomannomutase family protein [Deltaproteobacteria bacterium]|nr:phosphoglucomutase/phosphomannomutase family protein [Deltaproteobacteria bacterium]